MSDFTHCQRTLLLVNVMIINADPALAKMRTHKSLVFLFGVDLGYWITTRGEWHRESVEEYAKPIRSVHVETGKLLSDRVIV
jgi:hypothetical protein